ncbi:DUF2933 domain-containing protein [Phenylobacterium aquaticum]|uniref:DUF2933 domain-containing protein n=1 Tax=Phenylobacterium aquaticum TaxID=1763816 RepID=UPI001F5E102D|nr:DUF2933 domain-containing protein [Phenylobacterium aquaticum]MCI3130832.1 DUF2933 domain-containing protein [Phenylobacterium aquaticum]
MSQTGKSWTGTAGKIVIGVFVLALVALLFTEHRMHVLGWAPLLLLLLCPLLHMSMHGGHGGHGGNASDDTAPTTPAPPSPHRH